ncbi:adenylate/guanylate cyclase domain-containing protein [Marinimicrobium alkaliphilum]|uniref:adenylate/guanylate cyclase domain-containing protein n=1 Tax=Marinimicrobium alkaliphilum TaxID=2202654 RepID=UPI0018E0B133|nr:adenylate/guanylate cyclase domain-containing protein [Marinimicrobium alkaliphilum]
MSYLPAQYAVLFADVAGSSSLYGNLGDTHAKASIDKLMALMLDTTGQHGGRVIKTIGDEVMACFEGPESACLAALTMQRECARASNSPAGRLRIGIAFGPALEDRGDLFGDTVNAAAAITHIARAGQILINPDTFRQLPSALCKQCQAFDQVPLKGKEQAHLIYRLLWETCPETQSATTVISLDEVNLRMHGLSITLTLGDQTITIQPEDTPYLIGRDPSRVHLHVDTPLASREHCQLLFRRGKFVLADHSTNGTYVSGIDQPEIYLRREELPLTGAGRIALGESVEQASGPLLFYSTSL